MQKSLIIMVLLLYVATACRQPEEKSEKYFIALSQQFAQAVAQNKGGTYFSHTALPDCFYLNKSGYYQDYESIYNWYLSDTTAYEFIIPFDYRVLRQGNTVYVAYAEVVKKRHSTQVDSSRYIEVYSLHNNNWRLGALIAQSTQ
ncbi:MAG: nuclear transport factor 2 family protein [Bacteroidota bacterium]